MIRKTQYPWMGQRPTGGSSLIVAGSRTFRDYKLLTRVLDRYTWRMPLLTVVIGSKGRRVEEKGEWVHEGADYWAHEWALSRWHRVQLFWPDWSKHGRAAGPLRNREMAEHVSPMGRLVCFWNGRSPGTKNMIEEFLKCNSKLNLKVVRYK